MVKESLRNHIILVASDLFYEKGYNLTGINEIIEKSGIAKATLYNHFKSKEDLCLAYLDKKDEDLLDLIKTYCDSKRKGNSRLKGVLEFLIPLFESGNFNGCWCLRTMAEVSPDSIKIRDKVKHNKLQFKNWIEELVATNKPGLTASKQGKLTKSIYMLYEGAVVESHLQKEAWPIHHNIEILEGLLK